MVLGESLGCTDGSHDRGVDDLADLVAPADPAVGETADHGDDRADDQAEHQAEDDVEQGVR